MTYLLRFTSPYKTEHFFVRLGEQWGKDPRKRLVEATTPDRKNAREFETEEAAREVMATMTSHKDWEVVESAE